MPGGGGTGGGPYRKSAMHVALFLFLPPLKNRIIPPPERYADHQGKQGSTTRNTLHGQSAQTPSAP